MAFDVEAARKAGYSDSEIADFLASQNKYDAKEARKAGYSDSELIAHLAGKEDLVSQIPGQDGKPVPKFEPPKEPTLGEKAIGAGEAALSTVTGLTGGAAGMVAGTVGGLAGAVLSGQYGTPEGARQVEQAAAEGAQKLTYEPRTASGQDQTEAVGGLMQQAIPIAPVMGGIPVAAKPAMQAVRPIVEKAVTATKQGTNALRDQALSMTSEATRKFLNGEAANEGEMVGVGAAEASKELQRRVTAESLPVPIRLTKGQATRAQEQLRFEGETAKDPNLGGPLRENSAQQNAQLARNFEVMVDSTGAEAPNLIETGRAVVDKGLVPIAAKYKSKYRALYQEAKKAGEMEEPVSTAPLVEYLEQNDSLNQQNLAGASLGLLQKELVRLGGAEVSEGKLVPREMTLDNMEILRRQMNAAIDAAPENATNMRAGAQVKELIDQATEGLGGNKYQEARAARRRYAQLFEQNAIVSDLLKTRRGTADRQVALEDVFRKTILNGSREDLSMLRRTLQVAGDEAGHQAWRELQGATVRHLLDEATKGSATDISGNPIFSAAKLHSAVRALDADNRLEFVLGKKRAQAVRDLNEIAKVVMTMPPGAVNTSNTASVILAAIAEAGATGGLTGLPLPVLSTLRMASRYVKDQRIRQRVNDALGKAEASKKVKQPQSVLPASVTQNPGRVPESRTVH
jgi:hypothetical protein